MRENHFFASSDFPCLTKYLGLSGKKNIPITCKTGGIAAIPSIYLHPKQTNFDK